MDSETSFDSRVIAFRPRLKPQPQPRLNVAERMDVLYWADRASAFGVRRVQIHEPEPGDDPDITPFLLVYRCDEVWAAWGVARRRDGYELWRSATGRTIGCFSSLRGALAAILSDPAPLPDAILV